VTAAQAAITVAQMVAQKSVVMEQTGVTLRVLMVVKITAVLTAAVMAVTVIRMLTGMVQAAVVEVVTLAVAVVLDQFLAMRVAVVVVQAQPYLQALLLLLTQGLTKRQVIAQTQKELVLLTVQMVVPQTVAELTATTGLSWSRTIQGLQIQLRTRCIGQILTVSMARW